MTSSVQIPAPPRTGRFFPRSSLARWAVASLVLFWLLLDLTPLFRSEADGRFADLDKVTGPIASVSLTAAIVLGSLAAIRSRKQLLEDALATGLGRVAFALAFTAVLVTATGPAVENFTLFLLGGATAVASALAGSLAVSQVLEQRMKVMPTTASGIWLLCLSVAAFASLGLSLFLPVAVDPVLIRTVTDLTLVLWAPAAASGLVAVLYYRERSVLVLTVTALMTTGAFYWLLAEFVFEGH